MAGWLPPGVRARLLPGAMPSGVPSRPPKYPGPGMPWKPSKGPRNSVGPGKEDPGRSKGFRGAMGFQKETVSPGDRLCGGSILPMAPRGGHPQQEENRQREECGFHHVASDRRWWSGASEPVEGSVEPWVVSVLGPPESQESLRIHKVGSNQDISYGPSLAHGPRRP